jgi:6-phosphofructokinase 1
LCANNDQPDRKTGPLDASSLKPYHLATWQRADESGLPNERLVNKILNPMAEQWQGMNFVNPDELVMGHIIKNDSKEHTRRAEVANGCVRANAARDIYWAPEKVKVGMVTCGGLCPGLNSIIREITNVLWYDYGIKDITGMTGGYNGLSHPEQFEPMELNPSVVRTIHMQGGSILKAGRGGLECEKIINNLRDRGINVLFVIGGDGTQFAAHLLFKEAKKQDYQLSIVGVPKSIDNDVLFIDKTFGFESAVATASDIIRNAWVEASSCENGVGVVKLMGRDAGFVAVYASLASTLVDVTLIPEVDFKLADVHNHVYNTLKRKGHCVVVVAEGAGQKFVATDAKDATGHQVYGDIGVFMKDSINAYLKDKGGRCFYIDPSYIIRSCPIRPNDHIYCLRLASDAVHTAMRGYSGVCVGALHNVICIFPSNIIASGKRKMGVNSSFWQHAVQRSKMPVTLSGYSN